MVESSVMFLHLRTIQEEQRKLLFSFVIRIAHGRSLTLKTTTHYLEILFQKETLSMILRRIQSIWFFRMLMVLSVNSSTEKVPMKCFALLILQSCSCFGYFWNPCNRGSTIAKIVGLILIPISPVDTGFILAYFVKFA